MADITENLISTDLFMMAIMVTAPERMVTTIQVENKFDYSLIWAGRWSRQAFRRLRVEKEEHKINEQKGNSFVVVSLSSSFLLRGRSPQIEKEREDHHPLF
ncbi:hypothetical protein L1887_07402 [Cichorium endivia]|nr:hypothetical protein L1887_07402 [Cichorium endivia]